MPSRPPVHRSTQAHTSRASAHRTDTRPTSAQRGYGYRWQLYRDSYLREHPLCIHCEAEGIVTPATEVDHIEPVADRNDPLFWPASNHQPLCGTHHKRKTMTVDRGKGRASQRTAE